MILLISSLSNHAGLAGWRDLGGQGGWGCATQTEACHIDRMFTYDITLTGPKGFQVSVTGPYPHGTCLIGDFGSLQEAEVFADQMRVIDADRSHSAWSRHACHNPAALGDT